MMYISTLMLFLIQLCPAHSGYGSDENRELLPAPFNSDVSTLHPLVEDDAQGSTFLLSLSEYVAWIVYTTISVFGFAILGFCFRRLFSHMCRQGVRGITAIEFIVRLHGDHDVTEINISGGNRPAPTVTSAIMIGDLLDSDWSAELPPDRAIAQIGGSSAASLADESGSSAHEVQFHDCM